MVQYPPSFDASSDNLQFRLVHHLATALQATRILKHRLGGSRRRATAAERGTILFQLDKICKNIDFTFPEDGSHEIDVIHSIKEAVMDVQRAYPQIQANSFPAILAQPVVQLTPAQEAVFNALNEAIYEVNALL